VHTRWQRASKTPNTRKKPTEVSYASLSFGVDSVASFEPCDFVIRDRAESKLSIREGYEFLVPYHIQYLVSVPPRASVSINVRDSSGQQSNKMHSRQFNGHDRRSFFHLLGETIQHFIHDLTIGSARPSRNVKRMVSVSESPKGYAIVE
jgi:hypothetical protein